MNRKNQRNRKRNQYREQNMINLIVIVFMVALFIAMAVLVIVKGIKDDNAPAETQPEQTQVGETDGESDGATEEESTEPESVDTVVTEPVATEPEVPEITFTADLSAYEQYMNPQGDQKDAYLVLVNPDNRLTQNDAPSDLVGVSATRKDGRDTQKMREYAAMSLEALFAEADALGHINKSTGIEMSVTSAYRNYWSQNYTFENKVTDWMNKGLSREQAEIEAAKTVCPPGASEHQTGLGVDLHNQPFADSTHPEAFADSPAGQWIHENCWKFGFVLRFPADKTEITGIKYESWHFRYVGRYHAYQMTQLDMCLEEYVEYLGI